MKNIALVLLALLAIPGAIVVGFLLIAGLLGAGVWAMVHIGYVVLWAVAIGVIYLILKEVAK